VAIYNGKGSAVRNVIQVFTGNILVKKIKVSSEFTKSRASKYEITIFIRTLLVRGIVTYSVFLGGSMLSFNTAEAESCASFVGISYTRVLVE
jgi:hypothetical protein